MAARRQVIEVAGLEHGAPIPVAVRIGNLLFTSAINGRDPTTGQLADGAAAQAALAFQNLRRVLEAAGATTDDVAHVTVFLKDNSYRDAINGPWLEMFPDPKNRPARHAVTADLRGGMLIQLEVIAVL
ncbi:MAG TPA: RidA family protein [Chloroflexota bacterium]|nr:RidA family protein [Chloroflexota bacterium]